MDRMRESLFSILGDISGLSFIDLFSGSGTMGFEAESRGAAPVVLVERDHRKKDVILSNIRTLASSARLIMSPVERIVVRSPESYDIVFMDPPFAYKHKLDLLRKAASSRLLHSDTRLLIHFPTQEDLPEQIDRLGLSTRRDYGGSRLHIYGMTGH